MAWTNLSDTASGKPPPVRYRHGFTSAEGKLYVHGGCADVECENVLGDLHVFDSVALAWRELSVSVNGTAPTARCMHGFTSSDGKLYVHGGQGLSDPVLGDLYSFDPVAKIWTNLSTAVGGAVPTARDSHGFTSANGTLYVHGGADDYGNLLLSDLHSFDPVAKVWTDLSTPAGGAVPTARYMHGLTSADGKLYVHGGLSLSADGIYDALSDLHAFDLATEVWTNLSVSVDGTAPVARYMHGVTSADNKLYVHGGWVLGVGPDNDLWSFDPPAKVWTDLSGAASGTPPTPRSSHGFTSAAGGLFVHGGWCIYGSLSDLSSFDPIVEVWTDLSAQIKGSAPTAREGHGFASADGKLYVHGGLDASYDPLGDLYSFDIMAKVWTNLSAPAGGAVPTARESHGFASADGKLYVHGGLDASYNPLGDLHSFDPIAKVWTNLSAQAGGAVPTARQRHGFTSADGKLYVHGGCSDADCNNLLDDLYVFDPVTVTWTELSDGATSPPTARFSHGFTAAGKRLYVHDGRGALGAFQQVR